MLHRFSSHNVNVMRLPIVCVMYCMFCSPRQCQRHFFQAQMTVMNKIVWVIAYIYSIGDGIPA